MRMGLGKRRWKPSTPGWTGFAGSARRWRTTSSKSFGRAANAPRLPEAGNHRRIVTARPRCAVWQYACRRRLLNDTVDPADATAIGRRFQLALGWLAIGALAGLRIPFLGVVVVAAFNVFY